MSAVAVLYNPASPGATREVKEDLPIAARALGLTIQHWEVRAADELERAFAAKKKERPDGLYVPSSGPVVRANGKRIADLAIKSRLPSVYYNREAVNAGGLMYYGADFADSYRRVAYFVDKIPKGSQACGSTSRAADEVRAGDQSENRKADRRNDSAEGAGTSGQGD